MPRGPYGNHNAARKALARLLRDFEAGTWGDKDGEDTARFKALTQAFNVLLGFYRHQDDVRIEEEIADIRARLDAHGIGATSSNLQPPRIAR